MPIRLGLSKVEELRRRRVLENLDQLKRLTDCYVCNVSVIDGCLKHPIEWVANNPITVCDAAKDHEVYFQKGKCVCGTPYYLHASRTAPQDWVRVWKSGIYGAGFGVWANKDIKCGTTFGPYGGVVVNLDEVEDDEFTRVSSLILPWLVNLLIPIHHDLYSYFNVVLFVEIRQQTPFMWIGVIGLSGLNEVWIIYTLTATAECTRSRGGYAWLVRNNLGGVKSHLVDARNPLQSNWLRFVNCARCDEEQNLVTIQYRGKIYYRACKDITSGSELLTYYGTEVSNFLTG
ncbi:uncharacterized protein DEA37_0010600 [Paragonimus westermani]|uniref:SET domain-containing protein n=1 Tax=Paragonimus westermani TaxID=34504 RepID=A0A5J4NCQ4_9TREM|nr:uncharacterized protein DEA37_0010600 [Paragonimus westermani]